MCELSGKVEKFHEVFVSHEFKENLSSDALDGLDMSHHVEGDLGNEVIERGELGIVCCHL